MDYARLEIRVTDHAYEAYCDRVERISRAELENHLKQRIQEYDYYRRKQFIQITGVWWITVVQDNQLIFITCYGRSDLDMPKAIAWAAHKHDRINLDELPVSGVRDA